MMMMMITCHKRRRKEDQEVSLPPAACWTNIAMSRIIVVVLVSTSTFRAHRKRVGGNIQICIIEGST